MTQTEASQHLSDARAAGLDPVKVYQQLKAQGVQIEGDPTAQPQSRGVLGYLKDTASSAARELGTVAGDVGYYATNPSRILPDAATTGRDTIKTLAQGAVGAGENAYHAITGKPVPQYNPDGTVSYPGQTQEQKTAGALYDAGKSVVQHPLDTFKNHPLQTLSIVAPMVGEAADFAGLTRVAGAARALDPVAAAGKAVGSVAKFGGKAASEMIGGVTGAGAGSVEGALKATSYADPYFQGLRGNQADQLRQIVEDSQKGIEGLKTQRSTAYKASQEGLMSVTDPVASEKVHAVLDSTLKDFRIGKSQQDILDSIKNMSDEQSIQHIQQMMQNKSVPNTFTELAGHQNSQLSPLVKAGIGDGTSASKIAKATNYVKNWDELTPDGLDRLQKSLSTLDAKPGTVEHAFITKLQTGVKGLVKTEYPQYAKMLGDYHEASTQLDELKSALSLGDRPKVETVVRKMTQAMKTSNQGFEFRNAIIGDLENATGMKLKQRIAGTAMSKLMPRGIVGTAESLATAGTIGHYGLQAGVAHLLSPAYLAGLAVTSPRVMGELLGHLGILKNNIAPLITKLRELAPASAVVNAGVGANAVNSIHQ